MAEKTSRKFGVLDLIILVAAMAVGSLSIRPSLVHGSGFLQYYRENYPSLTWTFYPTIVVNVIEPWLAALTVACLLLRLRQPRPAFPRLMRQPGMAACLAAALVMAVSGSLSCITMAVMGVPESEDFYSKFLLPIFEPIGAAIGAVWIVMALARACRPESGWLGRAGRILGFCWIAVFVLLSWHYYRMSALEIQARPPAPTPAQVAQHEQQERALEEEVKAMEKHNKAIEEHNQETRLEIEKLQRQLEEGGRQGLKAAKPVAEQKSKERE